MKSTASILFALARIALAGPGLLPPGSLISDLEGPGSASPLSTVSTSTVISVAFTLDSNQSSPTGKAGGGLSMFGVNVGSVLSSVSASAVNTTMVTQVITPIDCEWATYTSTGAANQMVTTMVGCPPP